MKEHQHNLNGSWFYSDSYNDLPLLLEADNPIVVDADDRLLTYAKEHSWQIMSLR